MCVPEIDKLLGIEIYATKTFGLDGVIRKSIDDFVVEEVLVDGSKANADSQVSNRILGSALQKQQFLLCVLVKRNWDMFIAIRNISKQLSIDQKRIQVAGIKDAKAVTAQHVTIERASSEDISKINVKDIEIRPVGYIHNPLSSYYLLGNHFTIKIKSIKLTKSTIEKRVAQTMRELEEHGGIPNFFGHQRFGTTRPITHLVGKALSKGLFEEAAMVFLAKPSVHEHPASRQARLELSLTRNFKRAQQDFPKQLRFERLIIDHLVNYPDDYVGAFKRLPVKLQALFVQAYQSYLFNRFLSERVKNGLSLSNAEIGDYVVDVERSGLPIVNTPRTVSSLSLKKTNECIKTGRTRIALPIIGVKQKLSQGAMGQIEKKVLEEECVDMADFRVNGYSSIGRRGGVRAIVTPVKDFKLLNISEIADNESEVSLSFMLHRGSYATVLLRELMKPINPISAGF